MSRPTPAQMPPRPGATASESAATDVDPTELTHAVGEILAEIDDVRRAAEEVGGDPDDPNVAHLDAQAELFERAHRKLTDALDQLDRV